MYDEKEETLLGGIIQWVFWAQAKRPMRTWGPSEGKNKLFIFSFFIFYILDIDTKYNQ